MTIFSEKETIKDNVGMVESGNFDFEYQPTVAKFSGRAGPMTTCAMVGYCRERKRRSKWKKGIMHVVDKDCKQTSWYSKTD